MSIASSSLPFARLSTFSIPTRLNSDAFTSLRQLFARHILVCLSSPECSSLTAVLTMTLALVPEGGELARKRKPTNDKLCFVALFPAS